MNCGLAVVETLGILLRAKQQSLCTEIRPMLDRLQQEFNFFVSPTLRVHALTDWPLAVRDSRGYNYAEATAGGVPLDEINPATMESRRCPGFYLVGEILDVDGRIGGFNFQWAWSSAWVAAAAMMCS